MFQKIKDLLYFPIAYYFRVFAQIKLSRWNPRIIVITGSNGKTTLLHLVESQIGDSARYSHHANSAYGIPFDILGLERKTLVFSEWIELFLKAPFLAFSNVPNQKIYVVEADCDRPFEGKFLSTLLSPEVTIWLSSARTHSMNFDRLVQEGRFQDVETAIAYEYGYFLKNTSKLVIVNSEIEVIEKQLNRTSAKLELITKKGISKVKVKGEGKDFLLPASTSYLVSATVSLIHYLGFPFDSSFSKFKIPPGRSSIFKGVKGTTIIDSSYNSNLDSATEVINMFNKLSADKKWVVIGDMLEQGKSEKQEHEKLANIIVKSNYDRVVLLGPRIIKYGLPIIEKHYNNRMASYVSPKDVLNYLRSNLEGGETILFKGARFLEGVIEYLLANKKDSNRLARREKVWENRRKKWGL